MKHSYQLAVNSAKKIEGSQNFSFQRMQCVVLYVLVPMCVWRVAPSFTGLVWVSDCTEQLKSLLMTCQSI